MRWIPRVLILLVAIVAADFAVVNRSPVSIGLWPLPWQLDLPLFMAVLGALLLGGGLGALLVWIAEAPVRRRARRQARELSRLEARVQQAERDREIEARQAAADRRAITHAAAPGSPP